MQLDKYDKVYFLGIGGIGMSALARWFKRKGMLVRGYDATPTSITQTLVEEGISIHFNDTATAIPSSFTKNETLVIYTPAISDDNIEFTHLRNEKFTMLKRSEVLGLIAGQYKTVAVAGTHGKTTTSALIAHILKCAKINMVAFLGGVTINYNTNLVVEGETDGDTIVVVEADEFDRSFLTLFPHTAVVTSIDADHLDVYGNTQTMTQSFFDFIGQLKSGGTLVIHESITKENTSANTYTYGIKHGQFHAEAVNAQAHFFEFDLIGFEERMEAIKLPVPGFHNIENAIAAIIVTHHMGVDKETIRAALDSFKGIKRRGELIVEKNGITYIDDYAHHPVEINSFVTSLRAMYPKKKITLIFQPHLYTRTRDFAEEFAKSLSLTDEVLLMDIYPAREKPISGISSDIIFEAITNTMKVKCTMQNVLHKLAKMDIEVLATVGAGDIDTCVEPIKELINKKYYAT